MILECAVIAQPGRALDCLTNRVKLKTDCRELKSHRRHYNIDLRCKKIDKEHKKDF